MGRMGRSRQGLVKIEKILKIIVEYAVYGLVFVIPFSKAAIEVFGTTAIIGWLIVKCLKIKNKELSLSNAWPFLVKNPVHMALAFF